MEKQIGDITVSYELGNIDFLDSLLELRMKLLIM